MLPNHPDFSDISLIAPYPQYTVGHPGTDEEIYTIRIGPTALTDPTKGLEEAYWLCYQTDANAVVISRSFESYWGNPVILFTEDARIEEIALTFDQLGRPTVFYNVGGTLKLYWYDPVQADQVVSVITNGRNPTMMFDYPTTPSNSNSDMIMFYVSTDNKIVMRYQRDRWANNYDTGREGKNIRIRSADIDTRNRLQLVYDYLYKEPE